MPRLIRAAFVGADGQAGAFGQQVGPAPGDLAQRRGGFLLLGLGQRWPRARRRATPVISASRALSRFDDAIGPC